jgi:hypothetical protein
MDQVIWMGVMSNPGIRSKWRTLAVPTRHPADMAVAATRRSWGPISVPDEARPAQRRACTRATSRSKDSVGNAARTASTKAARRPRCSSVALCTPCNSSEAVIAAIATSSRTPSSDSKRWVISGIARAAGRPGMARSSSMKTVVSRTVPMDRAVWVQQNRALLPCPRRTLDRAAQLAPAVRAPRRGVVRDARRPCAHDRRGARSRRPLAPG